MPFSNVADVQKAINKAILATVQEYARKAFEESQEHGHFFQLP